MGVSTGFNEQAQRAAVDPGALHIVQEQPMIAEQTFRQRRDREVAKMLVIDGVELALLNKVDNVRSFDYGYAGSASGDALMPSTKPVQVGDVREHVVGQEYVSLRALRRPAVPPAL